MTDFDPLKGYPRVKKVEQLTVFDQQGGFICVCTSTEKCAVHQEPEEDADPAWEEIQLDGNPRRYRWRLWGDRIPEGYYPKPDPRGGFIRPPSIRWAFQAEVWIPARGEWAEVKFFNRLVELWEAILPQLLKEGRVHG